MVGKKEYIQYFRMIPYIQPGDIRDAVEKESKKVRTPNLNVKNITPNTQPKTFKQVESDQLKALKEANKAANDLGPMTFKQIESDQLKAVIEAKVKEFQTQIEWYRVQQKEAIDRAAQLKSEMKRTDIEAIKTKAEMQSNLKTQETPEQERRTQSGDESVIYRERGVQLERTKEVRTPKQNVQNITPNTQPKPFKQVESDQLKALTEANKEANDSLKATVMAFKSHISDNNLRIKESAENIATIGLAKVRATRAINLDKYINQNKAETHKTTELGRRATFSADEKIRVDTEKASTVVEKAVNLVAIAVSKDVQLAQNRINEKQSAADIKVNATRETILDRFMFGKEAATHMTSELGQRAKVSTDEKIRLDTEKAATAVEKAFNLVTAAVSKDVQIIQNHTEALKDRLEIKNAYRKEREEEKKQADAARSLKRQKDKELNKYNGMSLPGIANKFLSEKIQTSLTKGLGKVFTGSQGTALSGALGKSIIAGVSTAASGAILTAVAAGAAALVALMIAPFKLILSFSQKAFNFLKGIATQTETFKKLMELVMMPFMLMFTLLFAPVLMALAPLLATVIESIASKQDAIMAVGAKIGLVIEKLFDDKMIETYIALIDQVVGAIDWFVDVVNDNLTIGNSIFETIVDTFAKVMSEVLAAVVDWAYSAEGQAIIKGLSYLIGQMIGMVAGFVMVMLPGLFTALEPSLKGIFKGVASFFGNLIVASFADMFNLDSSVITTMKKYLGFIADFFSIIMGFAVNPLGSLIAANENLSMLAESFRDLLASTQQISNITNTTTTSNVDNTHIDFGQNFGANTSSAMDAALVSMKMNGVI